MRVTGNGTLRWREPASRRGPERIEFCRKPQHPFRRPEAVSCHLKHFLCNSRDDFLPLCSLCCSVQSTVDSVGSSDCRAASIFTVA